KPAIGTTLREVLENDLAAQRGARPGLNQAAEVAAAEHDATTRILIETVLADEERHLSWLDTELSLYHRLGEPLYTAQRLAVATADASPSPA
ncbi:ferritin-like domain-containing protein, partial [Frankia sp. AvcI1]